MLGIGRRGPLGRDAESAVCGAAPRAVCGIDEREAWVVLAGARGVGPVTFQRLVATLGSPIEVLRVAVEPGAAARLVDASAGPDAPPTLTLASAATIVEAAGDADEALAAVRSAGVAVVTQGDAAYPTRLRGIDLPPPVLFRRANLARHRPPRGMT